MIFNVVPKYKLIFNYPGWPAILPSEKDTSLGLFPYFLILLSFFGHKLVLNILLWLQKLEIWWFFNISQKKTPLKFCWEFVKRNVEWCLQLFNLLYILYVKLIQYCTKINGKKWDNSQTILTENELVAQFVLLSGSKIYFFWLKYTSQTKHFFVSLSNWSTWLSQNIFFLNSHNLA